MPFLSRFGNNGCSRLFLGLCMKKRYTIGFISDVFMGGYNYSLWRGAIDRTENRDINLMSFSLTPSMMHEKKEYLKEYIINTISKKTVDGLIICGGVLILLLGYEEILSIINNVFTFPVVNVGYETA